MQQKYWDGCANISYEKQKEITNRLRQTLEDIRQICREDILKAKQLADEYKHDDQDPMLEYELYVCVKNISLSCSKMMQDLAGEVISHSVNILRNEPPCDFNAVALGSLARGEATPYSDLEYLFLIENRTSTIVQYFERLAVTSYFVIGNLGETKLSHMAIEELKGWFDDRAKIGFQIDSLVSGAGNIPTGNGIGAMHNHFIVTPVELASRYKHVLDNPDECEALKGDLTAMLTYTKAFYTRRVNDIDLFEAFHNQLEGITPNKARLDINLKMYDADVNKFRYFSGVPFPGNFNAGHNCDVKSELYRCPSILLLDLSIIKGIAAETSWEALEELHAIANTLLTQKVIKDLRFTLVAAVYIRLSAYLYHNSQDGRISVALRVSQKSTATATENKRWFLPQGIYAAFIAKLMTINIANNETEPDNGLVYIKTVDWIPKFISQYTSHRVYQAMSTLEKVLGNHLFEDPDSILRVYGIPDMIVFHMAQTLLVCGKPKPALKLYQHIHNQGERNCQAEIAKCLLESKKYDGVIEILQPIIQSVENSDYQSPRFKVLGGMHETLAYTYHEMGDGQNAERHAILALQFALNINFGDTNTDYHGNRISSKVSHKTFLNIENRTPEKILKLIKPPSPDTLIALELLSKIYISQNRLCLAKAYVERIDDMLKEFLGEEALFCMVADNLTQLASIHEKEETFAEAIKNLRRAVAVYEELAQSSPVESLAHLYLRLACVYSNIRLFELVEEYINKAVPLYAKTGFHHSAPCYDSMGDLQKGVAIHY